MSEPSKAVAVPSPRMQMSQLLEKAQPLLMAVAAKHINPERLSRMTLMAVTQQPLLLKSDPRTIVLSMLRAAEMGLEIGGGFGHAYLVPFFNDKPGHKCYEAQLIVGYQGYIELALRSGKVKTVRSVPVYAEDTWEYEEGTTPYIRHRPKLEEQERTWETLRLVYAVATLPDGSTTHDVMTKKELEAIKARSKSGKNGPWVTDPIEMARKSPVRRLQKYLPKTREMAQAVALDEEDEGVMALGVFQSSLEQLGEIDPTPQLADKGAKGLRARVGAIAPPAPEDERQEHPDDEELDRQAGEESGDMEGR